MPAKVSIAQELKVVYVDPVSGALITTSPEILALHGGNHFFVKTFLADAGGDGSITEFMFTTPNTSTRIHAKAVLVPDVDYTIEIWEGITTSDDGTPIAMINNDRDFTTTPELIAYAAPTVTDDGTLIWAARNGGGKNPIGVTPGLNYAIMAKTNSKYLFRLTKNIANAGVVDIDFWWTEGEDKY